MNFIEQNQKERMQFIKRWADYVRTHPDEVWSAQQNTIINSALRTASISKKEYLQLDSCRKKY